MNTWLFKIDNEFNGRGHASLQVDQIKTVVELRRTKVDMTAAIIQKLQGVIEKTVSKKVKVAMPSLYRSWDSYLGRLCEVGGVIEAAPLCPPTHIGKPSVAFFIEPSGNIDLVGSFDKFEATKYVNAGCFFPQTSVAATSLVALSKSVGSTLYEKGVIGHVTVDLVSFPNTADPAAPPQY